MPGPFDIDDHDKTLDEPVEAHYDPEDDEPDTDGAYDDLSDREQYERQRDHQHDMENNDV